MGKKALFWVLIAVILIFSSCGQAGSAFTSSHIYEVSARTDTHSLEEYAVLLQNDTIRPYFVSSVANDPDIRGISVHVQTISGVLVGEKIRYVLRSAGMVYDPDVEEKPAITAIPEPKETGVGTPDSDSYSKETDSQALQTSAAAKTNSQSSGNGTAASKKEARLISVARLDGDMPGFSLPKDLKIGSYTMVFQILGAREILSNTEKTIYFLSDANYSIDDIESYLPGYSGGSHLVPPGSSIILEARITADKRLNPYIIWYNGKNKISEGFLSTGANRLLWKAPAQNGFQPLRAEVLPFRPVSSSGFGSVSRGKAKELSLPVSSKGERLGYVEAFMDEEQKQDIVSWYQLWGNLEDSKTPDNYKSSLVSRQYSRWLPASGVYGLAIGPEDRYKIPLTDFIADKAESGAGQIMLRFKPVDEGIILKAFLEERDSPSAGINVTLSHKNGALKLAALYNAQKQEAETYIPSDEEFVTAFITIIARQDSVTIALRIDDTGIAAEERVLMFTVALSGKARWELGAAELKSASLQSTAGFEKTQEFETETYAEDYFPEDIDFQESVDTGTSAGTVGAGPSVGNSPQDKEEVNQAEKETAAETVAILDELAFSLIPMPVEPESEPEEEPVEEQPMEMEIETPALAEFSGDE